MAHCTRLVAWAASAHLVASLARRSAPLRNEDRDRPCQRELSALAAVACLSRLRRAGYVRLEPRQRMTPGYVAVEP